MQHLRVTQFSVFLALAHTIGLIIYLSRLCGRLRRTLKPAADGSSGAQLRNLNLLTFPDEDGFRVRLLATWCATQLTTFGCLWSVHYRSGSTSGFVRRAVATMCVAVRLKLSWIFVTLLGFWNTEQHCRTFCVHLNTSPDLLMLFLIFKTQPKPHV